MEGGAIFVFMANSFESRQKLEREGLEANEALHSLPAFVILRTCPLLVMMFFVGMGERGTHRKKALLGKGSLITFEVGVFLKRKPPMLEARTPLTPQPHSKSALAAILTHFL